MLKNFDNRLTADVIRVLRAMGHGDDLVIADTNFPSDSIARQTATGKLLRMDNLTAAQAIEAILTVLPLDGFVEHPAARMGITGDESKVEKFLDLMKTFGVTDLTRTGKVALPRK